MKRGRAAGAAAAAAASLMLIGAASASAASFDVNQNGDQADASLGDGHCDWDTGTAGDQCTLRAAIQEADDASDADSISFSIAPTPAVITLTSALPGITHDLSIAGPGAGDLSVDGNDQYPVLNVGFGVTASASGLAIVKGLATQGAGIYNSGTLSLTNTVVRANTTAETDGLNSFPEAGGIYNGGVLTITLSTISGNKALAGNATNQNAPEGGGIFNSGTLTIDRSSLTGNQATADGTGGDSTNAVGGAIDNAAGTLTIRQSTFSGNQATGANGASSNTAQGGAVFTSSAATMTMDRSTVAANSSTNHGGGIESTGPVAITSSTIAENSGLIASNADLTPTDTLKNTIVSNPGGGGANCSGVATSLGHNLEEDALATCGFSTTQHDIVGQDPLLDVTGLDDNGGPTQTIALQTSPVMSPAIDKGISSAGETTDQRGSGFYRPLDFLSIPNASGGNGADIGAYEVQATSAPGTKITSHSKHRTHSHHATVHFASTGIGPGTFQCRVNHEGWKSCHSAKRFHLKVGHNTFRVRAKVAGMTDSSPATTTFKRV